LKHKAFFYLSISYILHDSILFIINLSPVGLNDGSFSLSDFSSELDIGPAVSLDGLDDLVSSFLLGDLDGNINFLSRFKKDKTVSRARVGFLLAGNTVAGLARVVEEILDAVPAFSLVLQVQLPSGLDLLLELMGPLVDLVADVDEFFFDFVDDPAKGDLDVMQDTVDGVCSFGDTDNDEAGDAGDGSNGERSGVDNKVVRVASESEIGQVSGFNLSNGILVHQVRDFVTNPEATERVRFSVVKELGLEKEIDVALDAADDFDETFLTDDTFLGEGGPHYVLDGVVVIKSLSVESMGSTGEESVVGGAVSNFGELDIDVEFSSEGGATVTGSKGLTGDDFTGDSWSSESRGGSSKEESSGNKRETHNV